jgi:hypothetical protein
MNRLQVIAKIMAVLAEDCGIKPGSREHKVAKRVISRKVERLGPDGAFVQIIDHKNDLLRQVDMIVDLEESGINYRM